MFESTESTECSASLRTSSPAFAEAPTFKSQSRNARPLGNVQSTATVIGVFPKPCAERANVASGGPEGGYGLSGVVSSELIQRWCQCEPKMRPPRSAYFRTSNCMAGGRGSGTGSFGVGFSFHKLPSPSQPI